LILTSAKNSGITELLKGEIQMKIVPRNYYLDDLFDSLLTTENNKLKCDIYEKDGAFHLEMDIPGFKKEEIRIESNKGNIIVTAEKSSSNEEVDSDKKYLRRERVYGKFQRSFYLGDIEEEKIEASFTDGTLCIIVPKEEVRETKKFIEVK